MHGIAESAKRFKTKRFRSLYSYLNHVTFERHVFQKKEWVSFKGKKQDEEHTQKRKILLGTVLHASKHFSGKFIVRVPPEVHRRLALEASENGVSLNRLASAKLAH